MRPARPRGRTARGVASDKGERIGIFICRCGETISRTVDVDSVAAHVTSLDSVALVEVMDFPCSTRGQTEIRDRIKEKSLGRFVVAGCSPKTHERTFMRVAASSGLNRFMFEIANIREQCAFVHARSEATEKAKVLVEAATSKCRLLSPAPYELVPVSSKKALVVGGGLSAVVAASCVSSQGFGVILVDQQRILDENAVMTNRLGVPAEYFKETLRGLRSDPLVRKLSGSEVIDFQGHPGDFRALIRTLDGEEDIRCGAAILALDATPIPSEGKDEGLRVINQTEFGRLLSSRTDYPERIVMIIPKDSSGGTFGRSDHLDAITNAMRLKVLLPSAEVTIIGSDVRAYGMCELDYRKAQECGIRFVRCKGEVDIQHEGGPRVLVTDASSEIPLSLPADLIVLADVLKLQDAERLAKIFKIPVDASGLLIRSQIRLEPESTLREGVFLCGGASGPRLVSEELLEASTAASQAVSLLSSPFIEVGGTVAEVDPEKCSVCLCCIRICPYTAPFINEDGKAEIDIQTCQGCGICVGVCPSKAIQMYGCTDAQLDAQSSASIRGGGR
ncbi:MAG: 4Fe-4S binding protein [Methanomassiliicoccales archaeon]|nr:4Fe-4S binding protein [Methanomassiliicoccales archaeon]